MLAPATGFYSTKGLGKNEVRIAYVLNIDDLKNQFSSQLQKIFGKKNGGGRRGAGAAKVPLDDKLCSVIDFVRRQNPDSNEEVEKLIAPFFSFYADKTKQEKSNV